MMPGRAIVSASVLLLLPALASLSGGAPRQAATIQGPAVALQDPGELEPAVALQLRALEEQIDALVREGASAERLAEAHGLLGQACHAYSLASRAEPSYQAAQRLAPADFRWPYLLGYLLQQQNRLGEALALYERARTIRRDSVPLAVRTGDLHLAQNRVDAAREAYSAALALDPASAGALYGLGQVAMSRRDYREAVERFSRVLDQVPEASRVHYVLGLAYRGLGEPGQAQSHLARQGPVGVRVADPLVDGLADLVAGVRLLLVRGRMAFEAGRFDEAAEAFARVVEAEPDNLAAVVNLGSALAQGGHPDRAIAQFERALRLEAGNRAALYNLGVLSTTGERPDDAVRYLSQLVSLEPGDNEARLALGRARAAAGRLARMLVTNPNASVADYDRALQIARLAFEGTGELGDGVIVTLALAGLGRCDEARRWHAELVEKSERVAPELAAPLRAEWQRLESSCR